MERTHQQNSVTQREQISNNASSTQCSAFPSNVDEDYWTMTLTRLGFVFSTHTNAFRYKLNSKKLFPWFISAKVWRVAIQVLLKLSLKTSIILSFILASQTRSIFSCKSLPWAVTFAHLTWHTINFEEFCSCLFVYISLLYLSIRKKKLIRHHHHLVPFFRRIIVLFAVLCSLLCCALGVLIGRHPHVWRVLLEVEFEQDHWVFELH